MLEKFELDIVEQSRAEPSARQIGCPRAGYGFIRDINRPWWGGGTCRGGMQLKMTISLQAGADDRDD